MIRIVVRPSEFYGSIIMWCLAWLKSLPHNKILDWSKLKAFADKEMKLAKTTISFFDRVENIVVKGEIAGKAFCLFPTMFSKGFLLRVVKSRDCLLER